MWTKIAHLLLENMGLFIWLKYYISTLVLAFTALGLFFQALKKFVPTHPVLSKICVLTL